ncbi:DUF4367 domain-containing protein [Bacillus marasmi]|uniref:DUF4367 domain-containing protein n=1 Tax=Bacillus marasmi TaxID=1926279 RepID=UPI0011C7F6BE|nr:DUF4367 domain-containing protein [Bacillus marasmi]
MGYHIRFIIVLLLLVSNPIIISAKEIKYNHNSITIPEIKKSVDFTVLTPQKIPDDWTLDTKLDPWVMLHYMDNKDRKLMVAIHLRKGSQISDGDFPNAQKVDVNGNRGYFSRWADSDEIDKYGDTITGGILNWVEDGTHIEMSSSIIPKGKMLEIARSMK